jgi:AcrR family transcriptional regulator
MGTEGLHEDGQRGGAGERILDAADELFYREGIRAVGMDAVKEKAGVALGTLYRHFPSKDALVGAYLRRRDERWRAWLAGYVERENDPRERLLAVFDALDGWFRGENYRGCAFINAAGEMAAEGGSARRLAGEHKRAVGSYLGRLVEEADLPGDPEELSRRLMLLVEGAIVAAYVEGDLGAGRRARRVAEILVTEGQGGAAG